MNQEHLPQLSDQASLWFKETGFLVWLVEHLDFADFPVMLRGTRSVPIALIKSVTSSITFKTLVSLSVWVFQPLHNCNKVKLCRTTQFCPCCILYHSCIPWWDPTASEFQDPGPQHSPLCFFMQCLQMPSRVSCKLPCPWFGSFKCSQPINLRFCKECLFVCSLSSLFLISITLADKTHPVF